MEGRIKANYRLVSSDMALQNAFDVGSCTVEVTSPTLHVLWSGVLAKGQTSPTFAGYLSGEVLQAGVDLSGNVYLNWISGNGPAGGYQLHVIPSYAIGNAVSVQIKNMNMPLGVSYTGNNSGAFAYANPNGPAGDNLTGSAASWSPDPADVTSDLLPNDPTNGFYLYEGQNV